MAGLSTWALRQQAAERGYRVSWKQFASYRAWGVLPELPDGGWSEQTVDRIIKIRKLGPNLALHRRIVRLRNLLDFTVPPEQLRRAMIATLPGILRDRPIEKARAIYRAHHVKTTASSLFGEPVDRPKRFTTAARLSLPPNSRPPASLDEWKKAFEWPNASDFDHLAGLSYHNAFVLSSDANVKASGFLDGLPYDELVIFLLTGQLTIGDRIGNPLL